MTLKKVLAYVMDPDGKQPAEMKIMPYIEGQIESFEELKEATTALGLTSRFELIKGLSQKALRATPVLAAEHEIAVGETKIGGTPDLPPGSSWPLDDDNSPLSFVAQVNLATVNTQDMENVLPDQGLISFFYSADQAAPGYDPNSRNGFRVMYTEDIQTLQRHKAPVDLVSKGRFPSGKIKFKSILSFPNWDAASIHSVLSDVELHNYIDLQGDERSQLLGLATPIQGSMPLLCQLVTNGIYCGDASGHNHSRRKELEKHQDDWILLLQIKTEEALDMSWGDGGMLYYWIRKQDLDTRNFSKCWCILQF